MDKLKTREKIIIAIAVLGVIYAGYVYLIEPAINKSKTKDQKQEISAQANSAKTDNYVIADVAQQEYIVARAEANWKKNPFIDRNSKSYKEWASIQRAAGGGAVAKMVYSGYIDAGIKKIAIIDGMEYRVGEQLEMEGYTLKQVTPSQVLIVNINSGIEVEIPLSE
jgi:hypothetical protein